jgi:hypothetical protein
LLPPSNQNRLHRLRISVFVTSYQTRFSAPFAGGEKIRSPLRNKEIERVTDLGGIYRR